MLSRCVHKDQITGWEPYDFFLNLRTYLDHFRPQAPANINVILKDIGKPIFFAATLPRKLEMTDSQLPQSLFLLTSVNAF